MTAALRALIVDDEPTARRGMRVLLEADPEVEIVGESENGTQALADIEALRPDVVFLDIQMPGLNGFEVLDRVRLPRLPHVVFVTAYDRYAIEAFNVHAIDYLLKPFSDRRFHEALEQAKTQSRSRDLGQLHQQVVALLAARSADGPSTGDANYLERLVVKDSDRVLLLDVSDVHWIEARQDYVEVHAGQQRHLIRQTMQELESKLDPSRFVRIHRSTLVNLREVRELRPLFRGEYLVVLRDGTELRLSRRRREALARVLGQAL